MKAAALALVVLASLAAGCGGGAESTTSPSTTSTAFPYYFAGTLAPAGSLFYTFTLTQAGPLSVSVVSLSVGAFNPTPSTVVGLGFGTPAGTGCSLTASVTTSAGLTAQLTAGAGVGTFCVSIYDTGTLRTPTDFVVRIIHP